MTHVGVMEYGDFTNSSDDFDADRPWQAVGDIVDDLIRRLLAEAGGSRSAARGAGEEVGSPRTRPAPLPGNHAGEDQGGGAHSSRRPNSQCQRARQYEPS